MAELNSLEEPRRSNRRTVPEAGSSGSRPKIDAQGRAYATGKRKDAVARVWIKPGTGKHHGRRQGLRPTISHVRSCR
jgi:small subunit ribosomal protein S9